MIKQFSKQFVMIISAGEIEKKEEIYVIVQKNLGKIIRKLKFVYVNYLLKT